MALFWGFHEMEDVNCLFQSLNYILRALNVFVYGSDDDEHLFPFLFPLPWFNLYLILEKIWSCLKCCK